MRYSVDETVLTLDSAEWIRTFIPAESASVVSVCYAGVGDVVALAGEVGSREVELLHIELNGYTEL